MVIIVRSFKLVAILKAKFENEFTVPSFSKTQAVL